MLKSTSILFLLLCFLMTAITNNSHGQCGVTPVLSSQGGGPNLESNIHGGATIFDPGWTAYSWEWEVNNVIVSTDSLLQSQGYFLPEGFSEVCLTIRATNVSTGDSCTKSICNIFQSTGTQVFSEIVVSVSGMDVTAGGYDYGGSLQNPISANIDWGDGNFTPGGGGVHTYAVAGDYTICRSAYSSQNGYTSCRKVSVGNGGSNIQVTLNTNAIVGCYLFL